MTTLPIIHAVTTDDIAGQEDFVALATVVMRALGSRGAIHLRASTMTARRTHDLARELVRYQEETGAWLVVNDRVDVALTTGARGVQLTTRSLTLPDARRAMRSAPAALSRPAIGASVHTVDDARRAVATGDDASRREPVAWLVAGHVYATPSHAGEVGRGASFLTEICAAVSVPVIAIGGVRPADVSGLLAAGAYGIAAIRGIWRAVDAERAVADYLSAYDAVGHGRADTEGQAGSRS